MAIFASFTALNLTDRVTASKGWVARLWLSSGALAMGVGIWAMHFLGMLAFRLPIPMGFDPGITFLSALIAIASAAFALWMVCQNALSPVRLVIGSFIMGAGVCGMHFTGMAAMRMNPAIHYIPSLLALSVVIAIVASGLALWLGFHLRNRTKHRIPVLAAAAAVMGLAISGMHYTAMAAAQFRVGSVCEVPRIGASREWLAAIIIIVAMSIILMALVTAVLDFRLQSRTEILSSSLEIAHSKLQFLALHDSLTKLPNRTLFEDRLEREKQNAIRIRSLLAVLFLDLDEFKEVNDTFGHQTGDQLLLELSHRLQDEVRRTDTLARLGGDEFVLLARSTSPDETTHLADRLITAVQKPFVIAGQKLQISASIGIALFDGRSQSQEDLVKNADVAMYRAKEMGRNRYCFFEKSMDEALQRKRDQLRDLRFALKRGEFLLHYQPKFGSSTGQILGMEALLRWRHPSRGFIPPNQFIPLAEQTGLILQIGEWVLDEACRQIAEWRAAFHSDWHVSVNLSPRQFTHHRLVRLVQETLQRHKLAPEALTLEITESSAMEDVESSTVILQQLSDMGVRISIDDFGTGYCSLLYLKRLPAHELKIDRAFVQNLSDDINDDAIIAAIVALGENLNLQVVAEGVETRSQFEFLTRLGCHGLQGYFLSPPMPPEQFVPSQAGGAAQSTTDCGTTFQAPLGRKSTDRRPSTNTEPGLHNLAPIHGQF